MQSYVNENSFSRTKKKNWMNFRHSFIQAFFVYVPSSFINNIFLHAKMPYVRTYTFAVGHFSSRASLAKCWNGIMSKQLVSLFFIRNLMPSKCSACYLSIMYCNLATGQFYHLWYQYVRYSHITVLFSKTFYI